jgi:LacI family transcriptional regulator
MAIDTAADVSPPRRRITLQQIADALEISTATVSLALRDNPVIAKSTRIAVQNTARQMGYVHNRGTAALRGARTNIVAVAFHDITNPFFAEMLAAIDEAVRASGRTILLGTCGEDRERQRGVLSSLREHHPDGIIMCPVTGSTEHEMETLVESGIPIVQVSREVTGAGIDFVGADDALGTRVAIDHLAALGHRRIAMVGGTESTSTGRARHSSYREALVSRGLEADPDLLVAGAGGRDMGSRAVDQLLALEKPPTGVICYNDLTAFGVMHGLRRHGLAPGDDISVVGCDDVLESEQCYPALTTVSNRHIETAKLAARRLIERLSGEASEMVRIVLEPRLIVRGTTAAPHAA